MSSLSEIEIFRMNKPVITIQCGNYANYVGAHFWNLQEAGFMYSSKEGGGGDKEAGKEMLEIDNDVLYREGLTNNKEVTYTPRLVAVDLKGSLGSLPECGELYGKNTVPKIGSLSLNWAGGHQVFKEEPHKKNEFRREMDNEVDDEDNEKDIDITMDKEDDTETLYNLEDQVFFWSDFLAARYHPKSVLLCDSFQHLNTTHPFDMWGLGRGAWKDSRGLGEELEDRLRFFAEECDNLGGFQVVADYQDGFGGVSASLLDLLQDEYSNKALLSFPCAPADYSSHSVPEGGARLAGAVLTLSSHLEAGLVTPLSLARDWFPLPGRVTTLPHLTYTSMSHYSTSSVLGLALDTATLPYRRRREAGIQVSPEEISQGLTSHGRKVAALSADIPMDMKGVEYFESDLLSHTTPLLPGYSTPTTKFEMPYTVMVTVRGMKSTALFSKRTSPFQPCPSPSSYLETCIHNTSPASRPAGSFFIKPVSTAKPFPHIFSKKVSGYGSVEKEDRPANVGVNMATVLTSWEAGPSAEAALRSLCSKAGRLSLAKMHRLGESGVENEEWDEAKEKLEEMAECYTETEMY